MRFIVFTKRFQKSLLIAEYAIPLPRRKYNYVVQYNCFNRNVYVDINKLYQEIGKMKLYFTDYDVVKPDVIKHNFSVARYSYTLSILFQYT